MSHGALVRTPCLTQSPLSDGRGSSVSGGRRARRAVVIGRWGDDTALLRTDEGETLEAPVPPALRNGFDVGAEVRLDGADGRILGWGPVGIG